MKISDLEFYLVEVPCDGGEASLRSLLIRVGTDARVEGWGEARVAWRPSELGPRRDALLALLVGRSVFDIEDLFDLPAMWSSPLRAGVEIALWDAIGRAARQPLCHLWGGEYRQRIPVAVRLGPGPPDQVAQLSRELAQRGFHTQVATSCGRPQEDLDILASLAEAVGGRIDLRFDGRARYDLPTARDLCASLDDDLLQFFIDPLASNSLNQIAALRRQTGVPLAVCRAIGGPSDVLAVIRSGAAPFVVVELDRVGGLTPARKCAVVAEAGGAAASLGTSPVLGVGVAAMLQLAAATPGFSTCNECAYHRLEADVLVEPLEYVDGMLTVPQGPGLGVEVDRAKIEQYEVRGESREGRG
jgi:L-alanine-DL-glutamate epimerase-like enolase superfamily enzyme